MVQVCLQQVSSTGAYHKIVEMPAVPREGDALALNMDDGAFRVVSVIWTPGHTAYDVQVRFR